MRTVQLSIGVALILAGMAIGIYVTLHYFAEGILYIQNDELQRGLMILLVWSELFGIAATLALVVPGVLIVRGIDHQKPKPAVQLVESR